MSRVHLNIGRILVPALLSLLLCGIVAAEFPELLSLNDNTSNDFTVSKTTSMVSPLARDASQHHRVSDAQPHIAVHDPLFSRLSPFEKAELAPADVLIHHFIFRT